MLKLIEVKPIDINGNSALGVKIANPESPQKPVAILLIAKIESCTIKAKKLGVTEGMNGKEALKKMS